MISPARMNVAKADRSVWRPTVVPDRKAVLLELESILASPHFCNSKRYPALLRYVVEGALNGRTDLKERTLGIEVFHRPPDYDTNSDTVVRFTAGEVRKRLSLYYHDHPDAGGVQISLPAGSYTPEFLIADEPVALASSSRPELTHSYADEVVEPVFAGVALPIGLPEYSDSPRSPRWQKIATWSLVSVLALLFAGIALWRSPLFHRADVLDRFWGPVIAGDRSTLICPGGVVFAPERFSGVATAGKDIQYPFVSMQIATAIGQLGGLLQREGVSSDVQSSVSLPLNELRDRPVVLLGGYNNEWTIRLLSKLRFHFSTEPEGEILDRVDSGKKWIRDRSRGYSGADDYALVARFRDSTTGSVVVVLAGLGRNGTEAAAEFATNPRYLRGLQDRIGADLNTKNIEVVLKTSVIDGKTGAPSIEALHTW